MAKKDFGAVKERTIADRRHANIMGEIAHDKLFTHVYRNGKYHVSRFQEINGKLHCQKCKAVIKE
jgi:ABC-type uncharacterized transport system substrate-binding protein